MDLNKVMIIGNLARDPRIATTPSGQTVASFTVVTNRQWVSQDGIKQSEAEFHNVVAWGKLAEIVGQYIKKGRKVFVEGRLRTRDWKTQDGSDRKTTEIYADNIIILDKKEDLVVEYTNSDENSSVSSLNNKFDSEGEIDIDDIPI